MKKNHQLAATIAFLTIGFAAAIPQKATALTITNNFTVTATTGPLSGNSYTGSFTYNSFTGSGTESANSFSFVFPAGVTYTLANSQAAPLTFTNGSLTSWEFADTANPGNNVASGTPSFVVSSGQGIPSFLYGYDQTGGESYTNSSGGCSDYLGLCANAQGSGVNPVPFEVPGGTAIPVFGSALALGVMGSLKKRIVSK